MTKDIISNKMSIISQKNIEFFWIISTLELMILFQGIFLLQVSIRIRISTLALVEKIFCKVFWLIWDSIETSSHVHMEIKTRFMALQNVPTKSTNVVKNYNLLTTTFCGIKTCLFDLILGLSKQLQRDEIMMFDSVNKWFIWQKIKPNWCIIKAWSCH